MSVLRVLLKTLSIFLAFLAILIGICIFKALLWHEPPVTDYCSPNEKYFVADASGPVKRFSQALKFRTISYSAHNYEREALSNFVNYIFKSECTRPYNK